MKANKKPKWSSRFFEKERQEFFKKQHGCCGICGKHEQMFKKRLALDHNHKSGQLRGLLCFYCNRRVVGRLNLETAQKIVRYLEIERNYGK